MSYSAIVRIRPTGTKGRLDSGHAGITLIDADGVKQSFDYGHCLHSDYRSATSAFALATSKLTAYGTMAAYITMAMAIAVSLEDNANFLETISHSAAAYTSVIYGLAVAPAKATILKSENGKETPIQVKLDITKGQFQQLSDKLNSDRTEIYMLTGWNCIDFAKKTLREVGIDLPRRIINTPASLQRDLRSFGQPSCSP